MKILISFYEDKEEEGEEDVEFRLKKKNCVYVSKYKVSNPFPVCSCFLLYYMA